MTSKTFTVQTDTATVALFDMATLQHRVDDDGDWWTIAVSAEPEVASGKVCIVSVADDGVHQVRVTTEGLTPDERAYACDVAKCGLEVSSGRVHVLGGEWLPGEGLTPPDTNVLALPNGSYDIEFYAIDWHDAQQWHRSLDDEVHPDAPADFVAVLKQREGEFSGSPGVRVVQMAKSWTFPDEERKLGPEIGMRLKTKVAKGPNGLVLRECGPFLYRPVLEDESGVKWKDRILVEVKSVDAERKRMSVKLIEVLVKLREVVRAKHTNFKPRLPATHRRRSGRGTNWLLLP